MTSFQNRPTIVQHIQPQASPIMFAPRIQHTGGKNLAYLNIKDEEMKPDSTNESMEVEDSDKTFSPTLSKVFESAMSSSSPGAATLPMREPVIQPALPAFPRPPSSYSCPSTPGLAVSELGSPRPDPLSNFSPRPDYYNQRSEASGSETLVSMKTNNPKDFINVEILYDGKTVLKRPFRRMCHIVSQKQADQMVRVS